MLRDEEYRLVLRAQKNPRHFGILYERYYSRIRAYILSMTSDQTISEDLTSEVFERALKKIAAFRWQGVTFGSWLYRIARNIVYDFYRSAKRRRTTSVTESMDESYDSGYSLEERILHDERELQLYDMISKLSSSDQYLLYYRYFESMSVKEIAKKMKLSEMNVATRLHRIRSKLARL